MPTDDDITAVRLMLIQEARGFVDSGGPGDTYHAMQMLAGAVLLGGNADDLAMACNVKPDSLRVHVASLMRSAQL